MKCPQCQSWADVLETRAKDNNVKYRRYQCANQHRFSTLEYVADMSKRKKTCPPCHQDCRQGRECPARSKE